MLPEEDRKEKLKQMFVEPKPNAIIGEDKDES